MILKMAITALKKIALLFLGLILSLVLLEAGLRLGGSIQSFMQKTWNLQSIKTKGVYRILCLGECTTLGYPRLLERALNQRAIGARFRVKDNLAIDKLVGGMKTFFILSRIETYLDEFHPDMVIAMMGINDQGVKYHEAGADTDTWLAKHCQVYRLGRILCMHFWRTLQKKGIHAFPRETPRRKAESKDVNMGHEQSKPGSPFLVSSRLFWEEKYLRAENLIKKDLEINPKDDHAYVELGRLCQDHRKDSQAEDLFKRAIELNPKNDRAYAALGQLYVEQVKFIQAQNLFKKAMEMNPKNADSYVGFGRMYKSKGDYFQVQDFFEKAIGLNPENDRAYAELGQLYLDQGEILQAEVSLKKAVELNPDNYRAWLDLGRVYRREGKFPEAEDGFRKSIALNPVNGHAYLALGEFYQEEGKFPQAEDLFKKVLELNPGNGRAAGALVLTYEEMANLNWQTLMLPKGSF